MDITLIMLNSAPLSFPLLPLFVLTLVVAVSSLLDSLNQRRAGQKGRIIAPAADGERGRPVVLRPDVVLFSGILMAGLVVIPDLVTWLVTSLQAYEVRYSQTPLFRATVLFLTIVGMVAYLVGIRRLTRWGLEEYLKRKSRGRSALEASPVLVSEIMTPRSEVVTVRESATLEEVRTVLSQHKVSRLLVTSGSLDEVRGLLIVKDLWIYLGRSQEQFSLLKHMRPVFFVAGTRPTQDLLQEFRNRGMHFAVVLDEHGGVDGIVTLEDILEEIVGEIFDETDNPANEREVRETSSGDLIVAGNLPVFQLHEVYGIEVPVGEYDTVAGYIIHILGRFPVVGDSVSSATHVFEVLQTTHMRVVRVKVAPKATEQSVDEAAVETPADAAEKLEWSKTA